MKYFFAVFVLFLIPAAGYALNPDSRSGNQQSPQDSVAPLMTVQDVISLASAGVSDDVIIGQIKATQTVFELGTNDIIELKKAGVSGRVITAMIATVNQPPSDRRSRTYAAWGYYPYPYGYWYPWYFAFNFGVRPFHRFYHVPFHGGFGFHGFRGGYFRGGYGFGGGRMFGSHR